MRLSFHPSVQRDLSSILRHYDSISGKIGDQFFAELTAAFDAVLRNPQRGHLVDGSMRRVNLQTFPYHFLYRLLPGRVRVTIIKHNKRHPRVGARRR
jgi:plasmid stabilization system protein ParE